MFIITSIRSFVASKPSEAEMPQKNVNETIVQVDEIYETSFGFNLTQIFTVVLAIPIFAFALCLFLTIAIHYEESTYTHCQVANYLPSISAAIGLKPERYFWQFLIALQCSPRLFCATMYRKFYGTFPSAASSLLYLLTLVDVGENLSLVFLSVVPSNEAHAYHAAGFVMFVVLSQSHMLLKLFVNVKIKNDPLYSINQRKSYKLKKRLWIVNFLSILSAGFVFYWHNASCRAGVYTMFAICEYVIVLSNMAFHATGYYEFHSSGINVEVGTYYKSKTKPV